MIKKLKWKFVGIIMIVSFIIMFLLFSSVFISTKQGLVQNSIDVLYRISSELTLPIRPGDNTKETQLPYFTIRLSDSTGIGFVTSGNYFTLDEETIKEIGNTCIERKDGIGTLEKYGVRYLKRTNEYTTVMAFVDLSIEHATLANLLGTSAFIGFISLGVIFLLSLWLSTRAVKPISDAWEKQREFIADASHELNTPLTVIISNIGLLAGDENHAEDERIERVMYEAKRMKKLAGDLLTLARSDEEHTRTVHSVVNLSELVYETVLLFEPLFFDEGKEIECQCAQNIFVKGNETQLKQICEILIDNARKYSDSGSKTTVRLELNTKKRAVLSVKNYGKVITPIEQKRIFDRFYRSDEARTGGKGYGLGLAIANTIVQNHSGSITVASDEQNGTVFSVSLPSVKDA